MRLMFVRTGVLLFFLAVAVPGFVMAQEPDQTVTENQTTPVMGYALVMVNGTKVKVQEYAVDLENQTVYYKSSQSGLAATFPIERIARIVKYDKSLSEVPDDAMPTYVPEKTATSLQEDGGIPILFKVKTSVVSGGGSAGGSSRAGGSRSSNYRSNYRGSSSGKSSSSSSSSSSSYSSSRSSSSSSSSKSSSGGSADSFFDALFGGK